MKRLTLIGLSMAFALSVVYLMGNHATYKGPAANAWAANATVATINAQASIEKQFSLNATTGAQLANKNNSTLNNGSANGHFARTDSLVTGASTQAGIAYISLAPTKGDTKKVANKQNSVPLRA